MPSMRYEKTNIKTFKITYKTFINVIINLIKIKLFKEDWLS